MPEQETLPGGPTPGSGSTGEDAPPVYAHRGVVQWEDRGDGPLRGAYAGMPEWRYHRNEALSSTGAKKLTAPSTPAHFREWFDSPEKASKPFEIGRAAHTVVLGTGAPLHVVDADSWQTKAAREERELARDMGRIPVLQKEYEQVQAMADAIRSHPLAGFLFQRQRYEAGRLIEATGTPEVSLFWRDEMAGVEKRCRLDWLPSRLTRDGMLVVPDYKTCVSASDDACDRAVRDYGYHQQGQWNTEGIEACGLSGGAPVLFVFVFQEKNPPYLINIKAIERQTMQVAERKNWEAARLFAQCTESGVWPGYSDQVGYASLPYWDLKRELEDAK